MDPWEGAALLVGYLRYVMAVPTVLTLLVAYVGPAALPSAAAWAGATLVE